jgi:ABC-type transporter Mla subunit MlaD
MAQIEVGEAYEATTSALAAAKGQRLSLRRAIGGLEQALTQIPAAGEEPGAWLERLGGALTHLDEVFAVHVQVTEGAGGLYDEIVENAPRLANRVKRFRREHGDIGAAIRRGVAESKVAARDAGEVEALRDHAVRLLADLVRHRKRGLDLVYEAYHVDIGGES